MRVFKKYNFWFLILMTVACKKVITLNLKNTSPQIVIQGIVTNNPGPYTVQISKTVDYAVQNIFPPVTGALVIIKDNTINITDTLQETSPGIYTTDTLLQGTPEHTYTLFVLAEGRQYLASSTMPQQVSLDTIGFMNTTLVATNVLNAIPSFQDPAGIDNYYVFLQSSNKPQSNKIFTLSDRLSDGKYITIPLFNDKSYFNTGDTVWLEMRCVDKESYHYFNELSHLTNPADLPTAPANPTSNISNNALGYFSACTVQNKTVVVAW